MKPFTYNLQGQVCYNLTPKLTLIEETSYFINSKQLQQYLTKYIELLTKNLTKYDSTYSVNYRRFIFDKISICLDLIKQFRSTPYYFIFPSSIIQSLRGEL